MERIDTFDQAVTSAEERQHVLDGACWCGPDLALAELDGDAAQVVTHRATSPWPMACPLQPEGHDDPRLCAGCRQHHRRWREHLERAAG